jgi:hypothetical protein
MSYERAVRAIEQAAAWGIRLLHIYGGEPLLYRDLAAIVSKGRNAGMSVEMVTSTFSTLGGEADDLLLLHTVAKAGLNRILLSYDDGHAQRVDLQRFVRFAVTANDLGLDMCIYGLEARHFVIKVEHIKDSLAKAGIDIETVDWVAAMYSRTGRGAVIELTPPTLQGARCPYIMTVPTLIPDGRVRLCPCAVLSAPAFVLGHQDTAGLGVVLDQLQHSSFYRFLARHGPHEALRKIGKHENDIPAEMCEACNQYLQMSEGSVPKHLLTGDLSDVEVDYEALLPPHRRFLDAYHGHHDIRDTTNG